MPVVPYTADEFIALLNEAHSAFQSTVETFQKVIEYAKQAAESEKNAKESETVAAAAKAVAEESITISRESAEKAAKSAQTAVEYGGNPALPIDGNWWVWDAEGHEYKDSGTRALLNYDASYPSVSAMEADKEIKRVNTIAVIASSVEEEDNAKVYILENVDGVKQWRFLADLSGMKGETGPPGPSGKGSTFQQLMTGRLI